MVFNLAEGANGRNREAHVPAVLEILGIPYTHSDPLTMALTLDKEMAKRVVASAGIPTPDFRVIRTRDDVRHVDLAYPLIVKPANEGSSKGIRSQSRIDDERHLGQEVDRLIGDYGPPVLVETFLCGQEFTAGIFGNGSPSVLGVMEIAPSNDSLENFIYCVNTKREFDKRVRYICPPEIASTLREEIEKAALASYAILGCRDIARIDIRLDQTGTAHFLEANPLPGMAPGYSDLVILAERMGLSYRDLVEAILCHAFQRHGIQEAPNTALFPAKRLGVPSRLWT
jgi:D-alanine-D-alanine ligase